MPPNSIDPPPHRIRLIAAWQRQCGGSLDRIHLPDRCEPPAVYIRRFNRPSNLTPGQTVFLHIDLIQGNLHRVQLNGQNLAKTNPINLTPYLQPFNEIQLHFAPGPTIHLGKNTHLTITPDRKAVAT